MTLQASGAISLGDLQTEFGGSNPAGFDEYYNTSGKYCLDVPGIPVSGAVSLSQYYSKHNITESADASWSSVNFMGSFIETPVALKNQKTDATCTGSVNTRNTIGGYYAYLFGTTGGVLSNGKYIISDVTPQYTGNFTIEFWIYVQRFGLSADSNDHILCNTYNKNGDTQGAYWKIISAGTGNSRPLWLQANSGNSSFASASVPITTWTHVAWCRSGTSLKVYTNGTQSNQYTYSSQIGNNIFGTFLGALSDSYPSYTCDAYIRQFRMTAAARYTANFDPYQFLYFI